MLRVCGPLYIDVCEVEHFVHLEYAGNMGSSMEEVDKMLDLMRFPRIDELKELNRVVREEGSPDYLYILEYYLPERA